MVQPVQLPLLSAAPRLLQVAALVCSEQVGPTPVTGELQTQLLQEKRKTATAMKHWEQRKLLGETVPRLAAQLAARCCARGPQAAAPATAERPTWTFSILKPPSQEEAPWTVAIAPPAGTELEEELQTSWAPSQQPGAAVHRVSSYSEAAWVLAELVRHGRKIVPSSI